MGNKFKLWCDSWVSHINSIITSFAGLILAVATLLGVWKSSEILNAISSLKKIVNDIGTETDKIEDLRSSVKNLKTDILSTANIAEGLNEGIVRLQNVVINIDNKIDKLLQEGAESAISRGVGSFTKSLLKIEEKYSLQSAYIPWDPQTSTDPLHDGGNYQNDLNEWKEGLKQELENLSNNPSDFGFPNGVILQKEDIPDIVEKWTSDNNENIKILKNKLKYSPNIGQ